MSLVTLRQADRDAVAAASAGGPSVFGAAKPDLVAPAGIAGLVLAIVVGRRIGWPKSRMRPNNLTLVMIGAGLLSIDEGRQLLGRDPWGLPITSDPGWATQ